MIAIFKKYVQPDDGWPDDMPPLHWAKVTLAQEDVFGRSVKGGRVVAIVTCKNSHACALRVPPFSVTPAGVIWPSVACPVPKCDGHEDPGSVMEGWGS